MQINETLFIVLLVGLPFLGIIVGYSMTHDYRKALDKEYEKKNSEIYNKIRIEIKGEWSKGWDAAYKNFGATQKAYHLWFREHGYELEDINKWLENYMNKP